ncbi:hypothetical protein [uncultured Jannaschia sp.]|uniref:hypothetical protein n=1 Tax=uncultured Jannaschia sp. TaxID=293347 RepID=UPI00261093B7|nr:hypothetical protein [uncultured Jannaschia sp.]
MPNSADAVNRAPTADMARMLRVEGRIGAIASGAFPDVIAVTGNASDDMDVLMGQARVGRLL